MTENDFRTLYKSLPTGRLLEIVDNAQEYEPLAVEAARREIESRQIGNEQLDVERTDYAERKRELNSQARSASVIAGKLRSLALFFAGVLSPVQDDASIENKIKLIIVILAALFFVPIFTDFHMIMYMLTDGEWDFSVVFYFSSFIILLGAAIFLWLRNKFGWILTVFFFAYTAVKMLYLLGYGINMVYSAREAYEQDNINIMDVLFPVATPGVYIGTFLIFGAATWTMADESFRKVFDVSKRTMIITIAVGGISPILSRAFIHMF